MRFNVNEMQCQETIIRCVWTPAHPGANAPLVANWIEIPCRTLARHDLACDSTEGDLRLWAA